MSDQLGLAGQLVGDAERNNRLQYQLRLCRFCQRTLGERQREIDELLELPPAAQLFEVTRHRLPLFLLLSLKWCRVVQLHVQRMKGRMLETIDMIQAYRSTTDQLVAADAPLDARTLKEKLAALTRMRDEIASHFARIQKLKCAESSTASAQPLCSNTVDENIIISSNLIPVFVCAANSWQRQSRRAALRRVCSRRSLDWRPTSCANSSSRCLLCRRRPNSSAGSSRTESSASSNA